MKCYLSLTAPADEHDVYVDLFYEKYIQDTITSLFESDKKGF